MTSGWIFFTNLNNEGIAENEKIDGILPKVILDNFGKSLISLNLKKKESQQANLKIYKKSIGDNHQALVR